MAYLSCPSCGLSVYRAPHETLERTCPRCRQPTVATFDAPGRGLAMGTDLDGDRAVVRPSGELDAATADQLDRALRKVAAPGVDLVVDLRGLTFIDSSGIGLLLAWHGRARTAGASFELIQGDACVRRVFELCDVDRLLRFRTADVDEEDLVGS